MMEDTFQSMNTVVQLKVEGTTEKSALAHAKAIILDFEKRFNYFSPESEVSKLCQNIRVGEHYIISDDLFEVLILVKEVNKKTGGLFDVDFLNKDSKKEFHLIPPNTIVFDSNKTKINLGAIAKGFAADKAIEKIKELDVERAMISMGGQISCISKSKPWKVGLQNPDKDFGELVATLEIANSSLSTSAENYRGKHIKNPKKGDWKSTAKSISVFNQSGALADAYSTALFLSDKKTLKNLVQS